MLTNRQLVITQYGKSLADTVQIQEVAVPHLQEHQILIKNRFIGINAIYDREVYRGRVPYLNFSFPFVFGVEVIGQVVECGNAVKNFKVGDAVGTLKVGTAYQEYQICTQQDLVRIPSLDPAYLALNPTGISALLALEKSAEIKEGDLTIISAAAGGLGHLLVQLAQAKGARVIAICGSEEKVAMLKTLNACERILNHRKEDIPKLIKHEFKDQIDVAIDSVGGHLFDAFLANLAPLGKLVVCGLASELSNESFDHSPRARVYESIYWKGASVRCFMNHLYKNEHGRARRQLFSQYQNKEIQVKIDPNSFSGIEGIIEASHYLLAGKSIGKVVVRL